MQKYHRLYLWMHVWLLYPSVSSCMPVWLVCSLEITQTPPPQRHNISGAACNDVLLEAFWLCSICFSTNTMDCLCNHSPALICVISLAPLPRSRYLSLPSLIPLVRDFQGPGSKSPFSPFSPGSLIIRIQLQSFKLMFLIQSQKSISKHPFLSLPTLFRWGRGGLRKTIYVFLCMCVCACGTLL